MANNKQKLSMAALSNSNVSKAFLLAVIRFSKPYVNARELLECADKFIDAYDAFGKQVPQLEKLIGRKGIQAEVRTEIERAITALDGCNLKTLEDGMSPSAVDYGSAVHTMSKLSKRWKKLLKAYSKPEIQI